MPREAEAIIGSGKIKVDVMEYTRISRVASLTTLKIYHQRKIDEINRELDILLKDRVNSLDY